MKVLLLSPPYLPFYMRNARCDFVSLSGTQWYPILLGYCGAWLEKCGHTVQLIDAPSYGFGHKTTIRAVLDFAPDWLLIYTGRLSEDNDVAMADLLTEKIGCQTLLAGPYASMAPRQTLGKSKKVNLLVTGEMEKPVQEILEEIPYSSIKNLVYREDGIIYQNRERPYLTTQELDGIPFVSEFFNKHLDVHKYRAISEKFPFLDVLTGRGCKWGNCTYCLWVNSYIKGPVYNCRTVGNVMEELRYISVELPRVRSIMLQDDTFTEERAGAFSEAKIRAGLKIPWSCYARGNLSHETLKLMKKANCHNLHVGFESASGRILKGVKKGITREVMTTFAANAKRAGLRIHGDFAIGFPGETMESITETIRWACDMRPFTAQFQLMIPFPGTPFYRQLKENGWLKNGLPNYPELASEDMEMMAKKAYREFYLSLPYLWQTLTSPSQFTLSNIKTHFRAIPSIFWKKYIR